MNTAIPTDSKSAMCGCDENKWKSYKTIFYYTITMDIIQQLPFPDEICHKIVLYAFKSPHIHLREVIFKRALSKPIYQKLAEEGEIEIDAQGHVTRATCLWNHVDLESVQFDIRVLPRNLTWKSTSPARVSRGIFKSCEGFDT